MDMLLRDVSIDALAQMFQRYQDRSPAPHLTTPRLVRQAKRLARRNSIWGDLDKNLDPSREIPVIPRSAYRQYQRTGNRSVPQAASHRRAAELSRAAMALWLDHPHASVDYLQDLLWAYCDDWTWVMAAHEGSAIDIGSASLAVTLAEILHVLDAHLEGEVKDRVAAEVDRRIFQRTWDPTCRDEWRTCNHSWNHVCNGAIIRAALYMIDDPGVLAHTIHGCIQNMTYGLGGFTDDGGCVEGPGYWASGFGNFMEAALALRMKTAGELNLMQGEKIERICRYPLSIHIAGPVRAAFSDSHEGYLAALPAILVNQFFDIPELYELCETNKDGSLKLTGMHDLTLYDGAKAKGQTDHADYLLPDLGQVKLRGAAGRKQLTLVALAGHNGVSHNHNDVGSFVVHKNGRLWLVDPGGPAYTRKTFSEERYEIVFCNSLGHSVPLINGVQQAAGAQYRGELTVENLNGAGIKRAVIDMARAYPEGTVRKLLRTLVLNGDTNMLTLEDVFEFDKAPKALQEAFITFENVTVARNRQSVRIGPKRDGIEIKAVDTRGTFRADLLADESKEGRTGHVVTRIAFEPKGLGTEVALKFQIG